MATLSPSAVTSTNKVSSFFSGKNKPILSNFSVAAGGALKEKEMASHLKKCLEPCGAVLECTHLCKGTCGECFNGRVHRACGEHCGRPLVCGHT